ncbi:MAG: hypothetical protein O3A34_02145 [Actinomycetota bacterium]|nr:hypothetical protein [Actinomycetota bacterium]
MRYLFAVIDTQTNSGTHEETVAIDAFNDAVAHELAAEASKACNRRIEVRRFL